MRTVGVAAIAVMLLLFALTLGELLRESKSSPIEPVPQPLPALAKRVVLILVDGLRYDYAIDEARAPRFARHMREDASAEVWAGRVTMTSAGVLAMATGQRGSFAHIVLNLNASRATHNGLLTNARAAGLSTALAGDEVWVQAFGDFDRQVLDEQGLALEVDNSKEILAAGEALALSEPAPDFLVIHLVAPDHLGHAFRVDSPRYAAHLKEVDEGLGALLDKLPADTTVIALSDHGALDNGRHGVDSDLERRTPLFAYGPGIRKGAKAPRLEQVDVASTLAALLGVPSPTHGRGAPATELLDLSERDAALVACTDAERVLLAAEAEGQSQFVARMKADYPQCARADAQPEAQIREARAIARAWDAELEHASMSTSKKAIALALALLIAFLTVAARQLARAKPALLRRAGGRGFVLLAVAVAVTSLALTFVVDHTTAPYNEVRAVVVALAQLPLYLALLRPSLAPRLYARAPLLALASMPTILAFSYPTNARVHSFVTLAVGSTLWLFAAHADIFNPRSLFSGRRPLAWWQIAVVPLGLAGLYLFAFGPETDPVEALAGRPAWLLAASLVTLTVWLASFARRRDSRLQAPHVVLAILIAAGGVIARRFVPAPLGLVLLVSLPILAVVATRAGRRTLAFGLGFGAYGLVARDEELLAVAAAALVAEAIGHSAASPSPDEELPAERRPFTVATLLALLFSLMFLARVGVQRGLDFTSIDWGAGGFGDPSPSQLRITLAIFAKYVFAELLILFAFVGTLGRGLARALVAGSTVLWVGRAVTLALILFSSDGGAYWTALRTMSDLPSALLVAITMAAVLLGMSRRARSVARPVEAPREEDEEELLAA